MIVSKESVSVGLKKRMNKRMQSELQLEMLYTGCVVVSYPRKVYSCNMCILCFTDIHTEENVLEEVGKVRKKKS